MFGLFSFLWLVAFVCFAVGIVVAIVNKLKKKPLKKSLRFIWGSFLVLIITTIGAGVTSPDEPGGVTLNVTEAPVSSQNSSNTSMPDVSTESDVSPHKPSDETQATAKPTDTYIDPFAGEMILVSAGTFTMGCTPEQESACSDNEKKAHKVTLKNDFYIGKYEVTEGQWNEVMGYDTKRSTFNGDDLPITNVSWRDAQEFIKKLNEKTGDSYRLPTEAEWEYAARGGNQSKGYRYSGSDFVEDVATSGKRPVGTKKSNELGIHDMSGNVDEWVNDRSGDCRQDGFSDGRPQTDPPGLPASCEITMTNPKGDKYTLTIINGGHVIRSNRVSSRRNSSSNGGSALGFRLARSSK